MADVLFAEEELTVHVNLGEPPKKKGELWNVESKILLPGESISVLELPDYLVDSVKAGNVSGASIMTKTKATRLSNKAAEIRAVLEGQRVTDQKLQAGEDDLGVPAAISAAASLLNEVENAPEQEEVLEN